MPTSSSSGIHHIKTKMTIVIPPIFSGNVSAGVRQFLNGMIMRYSQEVKGIVLVYLNYQPLQSTGSISFDAPHLSVDIAVSFLVYRPQANCLEWGVVNKVSSDHVGLLIYGIFNASVPAMDLKKMGWIWDQASSHWTAPDGSKDPALAPGSTFQFQVSDLVTKSGSVFIRGRLSQKTTESQESRGKKKRKNSLYQ